MFDIKELVQALFANREEEGVYDLKSATRLMGALPENQLLAAMNEIITALQKLNRNPRINTKERFRTIAYLDEKTHPLLQQLVAIYFGRTKDESTPPRQALLTIVAFIGEMANAYSLCLRSGVQSFSTIDAGQLQLFTLRGLMYCRELTKWCYIRYLPVKKAIWNSLNQFYRFAEQQQTQRQPLAPYADHPATCPLAEYLHCLLLALATPEKLLPVQVDLISEWLQGWTKHLALEQALHLRQQSYAINLNLGAAPRRLQRDLVGEGWRYLNTGPLVKLLQENAEQLLSGTPPAALGLPDGSQHPFNIELMQRLARLWSNTSPPPARRDKRTPANRSIMVIQGVSAIAHHLWQQKHPAGESKQLPPVQHLTLENESASGLGVQLSPRQAEKLQIGEVVGIVDERQPQALQIGIIRRLACRAKGEIYAGIEILSQNPVPVDITPPGAPRSQRAIFSPDSSRAAKDRFLLLSDSQASKQHDFHLDIQGQSFLVRLAPAREHAPRAQWGPFFVLGKLEQS